MKESDYREIGHTLLGVAQRFAPDIEAQQLLADNYNGWVREMGGYTSELILIWTGLLYDGLAFNNWLWLKETKDKK